jgi:streptogramin lyase
MNSFNHKVPVLALAVTVAVTALAGCSSNTALIGRETLPARASQPAQNEMVGTVERIDTGTSEIHLRPSPGHPGMVTFSAETRVMYLGRVYPVSQLRFGDVVAMQMEKDSRGNPHTHLIDLKKSTGDWAERQN